MTDRYALEIADKPDWWMGPDGKGGDVMRSLRQAIAAMSAYPARAFLFRPGGFGEPAIWLSAEDIARLRLVLSSSGECAA